MGTPRTTLLIVLLCYAVEKDNAVPVPRATAPALPLETKIFTETYTEVATDTVQLSDTEGARQGSQEKPLTGQDDEPSTDTERDDQQSSAQKGDDSDVVHQNDAQGEGPDDLSESDTDTETGYDGTLLTSDKEDPEDDDAIVGGNDTHGTPHDAVNTTAESTESTPKVPGVRPLNTSSSSVSTSPMQGTQSDAQHDSASREVETAPQHDDSNPDAVSATPDGLNPTQHHSESSPAHHVTPSITGLHHRTDSSQGSTSRVPVTSQHDSSTPDSLNLTPKQTERSEALAHLTPRTSGISHHTTDLVPKIHHDESANDEINPPVEAYVTELYTEIMERTELVVSDTESESDDTVSGPEEEDSEQRDIISEGEDESDYTPHDSASLTPVVVSSIPRNTDSTPQSTTYALLHSSAKPLAFADRMDTRLYDAGSSPSIIDSSSVDTDLTSIPFDSSSQAYDLTSDEGTSLASATVPIDTHQAPSSSTDKSKSREITPFLEPMETEIYTEIMEVTELALSDAESESDDTLSASDQTGLEQSDDVAAAESDTSYTPKDYESSVMSDAESQFDDSHSTSDQTGSEQSDVSAAKSDNSYIQRDYVTALMSAAESESDNTPSASGDDGTEPSPEPVVTEFYTEMIEVTELSVADATAKSDDTALAPDNEDSEVRDNYSNEEHDDDEAPQVSPNSADNRSLFTPNIIISSQPTPAPVQERTRETPNTSSTGPRSTRVDVTPNVTRSDTAEISPAVTDTDSTPDDLDTTPKDSVNPSTANTESTLSEPRGASDVVTSTMDIPGDNLAPSQEPSMTEIYTETMEFTEILASNEKD